MPFGFARRRGLFAAAAFLWLGSVASAQVVTLFSENFEGPPGPPGNVGQYLETDEFGFPSATLWHEEGFCGANPVGGYAVTPNVAPFASILGNPGTTVIFNSGDDGFSGRLVAPFVFQHFGVGFQLLDVSRNGMVAVFPGAGGGADFINQAPGTTTPPNGVIGAWWDDTVHTVGQTLYEVQGVTPNRRIVLEWNSQEAFPGNFSGENATFQVVINETSNVLEFHYDNASFLTGADPWSATCGTESFDGSAGTDATGQGPNNAGFPATGFNLTPTPPAIPTIPPCMGTEAAAYNQGDLSVFTYNTGGPNSGVIESPAVVSTSAASTLVMIFDYTRTGEAGSTFDQSWVETSPTGAGTWTPALQITSQTVCIGPNQTEILVLPSALSGTSFQHRFRFDTIDGVGNDYSGWYVDNVRIAQAAGANTVAFSENFETGTVAGVTVGNLTEEDLAGSASDVLWHAETDCSGPVGSYTVSVGGTAFTSIVGSPSAIVLHGAFVDDSTATLGLGAFNFWGAPTFSMNVDSNGPVGVGTFSDFTNDPIPTSFAPNNWVAAWWDDNHTGPIGQVLYDVLGSGATVIEWNSVEHFPGGNASGELASFQVILNPSPADTIELVYDNASFLSGADPWNATIGIEDPTGATGTDATGGGGFDATPPATSLLLTFVPPGGGGTPIPAPLAGNAAAYNQGNLSIFNYNTGSPNSGALTSNSFILPAGTIGMTLAFDYLRDAELGGTFDQTFVDGRDLSAGPWQDMLLVNTNVSCAAGSSITATSGGPGFSALALGGGGQMRLGFDTVDTVANDTLGWYVDNMSLTAQSVSLTPTYGAGCPSAGGCTPAIGASGLPYAGNGAFAINLTNAQPSTSAVFMFSIAPAAVPLSLFVPGNTCTILVDIFFSPSVIISGLPVSPGGPCGGTLAVPMAIPCTAAGAALNFQFAVLHLAAFPAPTWVSMTPGMSVTVL